MGILNSVSKLAMVPYSAEQMYALVNDVESYPQFLPWCTDARVRERTDEHLTAAISMALGKVQQSFSTENHMHPGRRIDMRLLTGPFRQLEGYWEFIPAGDDHCEVRMKIRFEFKNRMLQLTFGKLFHHIVNSLVDAFIGRAEGIYGRRG